MLYGTLAMTSSSMSSGNPVVHQSRLVAPGSSGYLAGLASHSDADQAKTTTAAEKHRFARSSARVRLQRRYSTGTGTVTSYCPSSEYFGRPITECRVNNHYVPVSLTSRGGECDVVSTEKETVDAAGAGPSSVARQCTESSSACGELYFCFWRRKLCSWVKLGGSPGDLSSVTSDLRPPTSNARSLTSDFRSPTSSHRIGCLLTSSIVVVTVLF